MSNRRIDSMARARKEKCGRIPSITSKTSIIRRRRRRSISMPISMPIVIVVLHFLFFFSLQRHSNLHYTNAMKIRRPWTTKHWCESVIRPEWPFAYSKYKGQLEETKGRVSSNGQDVRHGCETQGVQSKCHICEEIRCGGGDNDDNDDDDDGDEKRNNNNNKIDSRDGQQHLCHFQLQGVLWDDMSKNIPTVSDIPWAVGGSHRYDFGGVNTTHVCMYMSSNAPCQSNFGQDYSDCIVRCWGHMPERKMSGLNNTVGPTTAGPSFKDDDGGGSGGRSNGDSDYPSTGTWPNSKIGMKYQGLNATPWILPEPTATWSYPKSDYFSETFSPNIGQTMNLLPQGFTFTLAGSTAGEEGFVDGYRFEARYVFCRHYFFSCYAALFVLLLLILLLLLLFFTNSNNPT